MSAIALPAKRRRFVPIVVVTLTLLALAGAAGAALLAREPTRRSARLVNEARIHLRTNRPELAIPSLLEANQVSRSADTLFLLARAYIAHNEPAEAERALRESLSMNPSNLEASFALFGVLLDRGELAEAEKVLEDLARQSDVVADEGERDRVRSARATLALRRGDRSTTIRQLEEILGASPAKDSSARLALAALYLEENRDAESENLLRSIVDARLPLEQKLANDKKPGSKSPAPDDKHAPDHDVVRAEVMLARMLLTRGETDLAANLAMDARARVPDELESAMLLVDAELNRGRHDAALAVADEVEKQKAGAMAALLRSRVARAKGDDKGERELLDKAASLAPGSATPAIAAARAASKAKDNKAALGHLASIDRRTAGYDERVEIASLLRELGDAKKAREELDQILALAPGHSRAIDLVVKLVIEQEGVKAADELLANLAKRGAQARVIERARAVLKLFSDEAGGAQELSRRLLASGDNTSSTFSVLTAALALEGGVAAAVRELESFASHATEVDRRNRARFQAASLYLALSRPDLAVPILERAVAERPDARDARVILSHAHLAAGRLKEARDVLAPLLDKATSDDEAALIAGTAALRAGEYALARSLAARVKEPAREADAAILDALGARAAGDHAAALASFERARKIRPNALVTYLGALRELAHDPAAARKTLEDGFKRLGAKSLGGDVAVARALTGDTKGALEAAKASFEASPNDGGSGLVLGLVIAHAGDRDQGRNVLEKIGVGREMASSVTALEKDELASALRLVAFWRRGLFTEVNLEGRALLALKPDNGFVALHTARACRALAMWPEGIKLLEPALAASPKSVELRLELSLFHRLATKQESNAKAIEVLEEGLALDPKEPSLNTALGMALAASGLKDDAIAAYRRALASEPRSLIASNNLAWLLCQKGGPALDEAFLLASSAEKSANGHPAVLDTLARIELARGDTKNALEHARNAVDRQPLDAAVRIGLARALEATGRPRDAANHYEIALLVSKEFEGRPEVEKRLGELRAKAGGGR